MKFCRLCTSIKINVLFFCIFTIHCSPFSPPPRGMHRRVIVDFWLQLGLNSFRCSVIVTRRYTKHSRWSFGLEIKQPILKDSSWPTAAPPGGADTLANAYSGAERGEGMSATSGTPAVLGSPTIPPCQRPFEDSFWRGWHGTKKSFLSGLGFGSRWKQQK